MHKAITDFTEDEFNKIQMIVDNPLPTQPYPVKAYLTTTPRITTGLIQFLVGNKKLILNEEGFHKTVDGIIGSGAASTFHWKTPEGEIYCIISINDTAGFKPESIAEMITHETVHLVLNIFETIKFNPVTTQEPMAYLTGRICKEAVRLYYSLSTHTLVSFEDTRLTFYDDVGWPVLRQRGMEELRMREHGVVKLSDDLASWSSRSWFNV